MSSNSNPLHRAKADEGARRRRRRLLPALLTAAVVMAAVTLLPLRSALAAGPGPIAVTPFAGFNSTLMRAPYVTGLTQTSADVNWATSVSNVTSPGSLQWGPVGNCTAHVTPVPANLPNSYPSAGTPTSITGSAYTVVSGTNEYQSTVVLTGLAPSTKYCYRPLGPGSVDLLGSNPTQTFITLDPAGTAAPLTFDVVGDLGETLYSSSTAFPNNLNTDQAAIDSLIGQSATTAGAKFVITAGDVAYGGGTQANYGDLVNGGSEVSDIFGPSYWPETGGLPVYAGEGNHGQNTIGLHNWPEGNIAQASAGVYAYDSYPAMPADGTSAANYPDAWYAISDGNVRVYVLNAAWADGNVGTTNLYQADHDAHWTTSSPEYKWLAADLASHPNTIKMAVWHFPLRSDNSSQTSDTLLQNTGSNPNSLEALLAANGVQLAFNGHAHIYQRTTPANYQQNGELVNYVTGGGGGVLEPVSATGSSACTGFTSGGSIYALGWSPTSNTGTACGSGVATPQSAAQVFNYLQVSVNGNQVTVTPINAAGQSFDQQTYTYSGVTSTPATVIDAPPPTLTNTTSATISFHAPGSTTYTCSLDAAKATACTSPVNYTGLATGSHSFTVTGNGATAATANWTIDTTPPSIPTGVSAIAVSSTLVNLNWTASTDNTGVTGYDIYRNGTLLQTTSGTGTTYSDNSVTAGKLYTYTVDARDGAGNVSAQSSPPAPATTPTGPSGPALVQVSGSSTTTVTLPAASTPGDLLVLSAGTYTGATKPITAVSDGKNAWTKVMDQYISGVNSAGELWYAPNAASVQSVTVTTGATAVALQLEEFSGVATTSPLDTSVGTAAKSTAASSGSVTPSAAGELAVGFIAGHSSTQAINVTSTGFTAEPQVNTSSPSSVSVISGYQALSSTGAQSFAGSFATSMNWAAGIALFKPGAAPPPPGDFSIAASPASGTAVVGTPATATINTATISGGSQTVGLTASGLPTGASAQFNPASITSGGSSAMTITTTSATPAGPYTVTVNGTGTATSHTTTFALTVDTPAAITSATTTTFTQGTAGTFTVTTTGTPTPALSETGSLPSGVSFTDNGNGTATLAGTPASGSASSYPITISATGAGSPAGQSFTLAVNAQPSDFSVGVPVSATDVAGTAINIPVTTTVTLGASQTVGFSASGAPLSSLVSFNPQSLSSGASTTLSITPPLGAVPGTYTISVTGTGTTQTHTMTFSLVVDTPPTITSANTTTFTVGSPGTFTVTATGSTPIGLSETGSLPGGVSFTDNGDGTATLAGTPVSGSSGTYAITISASNGYGTPPSQSFSLVVNAAPPPPDFTIAASPNSASVASGSAATTSIGTTAVNGPQSVALSATGLPTGATVSFTPASVTSGGSSTMQVTTASGTTPGPYPITVTGIGNASGTPTHSTTFTLTVTSVASAPHLVQTASGTETASSTTLSGSFPTQTGGGDLLVLSASEYNGATNHITSVTDTGGNTWKLIGSYNVSGHNSNGEMWYAANASPTLTVTVHNSSAAFVSFEVQEFAGVAASGPLDVSTGTSNTSTAPNSGAVTSTAANELAVGFIAGHNNAEAITVTSSGYTVQSQQTTTGSIATVITGYQVLGAPGSQSFAGSFGTAMYWAAGIAVFKPGP